MANSTIPNLVAVTVPALTDLFGVRQSGDTRDKKLTVTQLLTLVPSGGDVSKVGTPADNQLGVWTGDGTIEGDTNFEVVGTSFKGQLGNGPGFFNINGVNIVPKHGDPNTGLQNLGDDRLGLISGGVVAMKLIEASAAVFQLHQTNVGITAFAGGGQGSATQLNSSYNVVDTVATTGDSVKFSPTLEVGIIVYVKNDGANAMDLFPAGGDDLGFGVGVALSVGAGATVAFIGSVISSVWTQLIFEVLAGGGDVTKVGTPVNNQVGVWTGDGTIEGDTGLTFDAGVLASTRVRVGNGTEAAPAYSFTGETDLGFRNAGSRIDFIAGGATKFSMESTVMFTNLGAALMNEVPSATNPTLVPLRSDLDTGIGQNAADQVSIIAGGVEIARAVEAAVEQFIISPGALLGSAALPSLAFGDGDTGFRESFADTIKVGLAGVDRWTFTGDRFVAVAGNGPSLQNEGSTATNPTLIPALGDVTTGIGGVTGGLNIIVQSVNAMQFDEAGGVITIRAEGVVHGFLGTVAAPGYSFRLDSNTGMFSGGAGSDELKFSAGGVEALSLNELNSGVIQAHQANLAITAFATGGQASATQLDESYNVLTTVATTGDSVKLPPVFAVNSVVYIKNDGANAADVFPATGDDLGAGLNTAVSLAAGESASFIATVASATWTPWIVDTAGGDLTSIAAGSAGSPSLAWGDGDTGFYQLSDGIINFTSQGVGQWSFRTGSILAFAASGPMILNETASATNPTLIPSSADLNTGVGWTGADQLDLIAGGLSCISVRETAAARQIGFYTTAPISQQTGVAVTDVAIHAALVALGLITA